VKRPQRALRTALPLAGVVVFLLAWQLAAAITRAPSIFPKPIPTIRAAGDFLSAGYFEDLAATGLRAIGSWVLALFIGVPIGLMLGLSRWANDLSQGVVAFLRSLPAFMLIMIPVALGLGGEISRIATITLASLLIIIDECAESLLTLPQDRVDLIRAYRGRFWFILTQVLIFEALGRAVVPVARTTIGISFIVAIVCETLLIPPSGVGARLLTSLSGLEMASVYAFLLLTGTAGLILNSCVHFLARRIIFWT